MKTILVDAVYCLVFDTGELFREMHELIETYPNRKIVLTGADDAQFERWKLDELPYEVFTRKHDPEKTDPAYYRQLLEQFSLSSDEVIYFEHNPKAVESARSIGITSYLYDDSKKDLGALKQFLDAHL